MSQKHAMQLMEEYTERLQEATYKEIREALLLILGWECPSKSQAILDSLDDAVANNIFI